MQNGRGCLRAGELLGRAGGPFGDVPARDRFLAKACSLGEASACPKPVPAASSPPEKLEEPAWDDKKPVTAKVSGPPCTSAEECGAACERNELPACSHLGVLHATGRDAAKDPAKALVLFRKACAGGYLAACGLIGNLYLQGTGVPRNPAAAAALFKRACDADHGPSCRNLGTLALSGEVGRADAYDAAVVYEKACRLNDAKGCANLGQLYRKGLGVGADPAKADALTKKACALGEQAACAAPAEPAPPTRPEASPAASEASPATHRGRVRVERGTDFDDDQCKGKGKPPVAFDYKGGTYEENARVARAHGCVLLSIPEVFTWCCPARSGR
jgi:hypothetical protein